MHGRFFRTALAMPFAMPVAAAGLAAPLLLAAPAEARDGCGLGFHRGFYGFCRPNLGPVFYGYPRYGWYGPRWHRWGYRRYGWHRWGGWGHRHVGWHGGWHGGWHHRW